jgi:hypothetical protein
VVLVLDDDLDAEAAPQRRPCMLQRRSTVRSTMIEVRS